MIAAACGALERGCRLSNKDYRRACAKGYPRGTSRAATKTPAVCGRVHLPLARRLSPIEQNSHCAEHTSLFASGAEAVPKPEPRRHPAHGLRAGCIGELDMKRYLHLAVGLTVAVWLIVALWLIVAVWLLYVGHVGSRAPLMRSASIVPYPEQQSVHCARAGAKGYPERLRRRVPSVEYETILAIARISLAFTRVSVNPRHRG